VRFRLGILGPPAPNDRLAIAAALRAGRIPQAAPAVMVLARFLVACQVQVLVAGLFKRRGDPDPIRAAARWYMPSGTLIDLASLAALAWLCRREGIRLTGLVGARRAVDKRQLLGDLGLLLLVFEPPAVAAAAVVTARFYGRELPPTLTLPRDLPGWAAAYSVVVWPAIWGLTEELVYLGYALPRLEVQLNSTWRAAAIVALAWAWQHVALPFLPDWRYLTSRVLAALAVTCTMTMFYIVRGRRLLAPIVAHWLSDSATAFLATMVPRLKGSASRNGNPKTKPQPRVSRASSEGSEHGKAC
jgi:membrane protease YdiL (CAAX protease family)